MVDLADDIVLAKEFEKLFIVNGVDDDELYQLGGGIFNALNLLAHLSNNPKARA